MKRATNLSQAGNRLYSQKDAKAILEQAIGADGNSFTDDNLKEMAQELGISPVQLEATKELWFNEQQKLIELEELKTQRWKMTMTALVLVAGMGVITTIVYLSYTMGGDVFDNVIFYVFFIIFLLGGYFLSK